MADSLISALADGDPAQATDQLPINRGGLDRRITPAGILTYVLATIDTGDITEATDKNFVSDAQLVVLGNTSGTNTGDQTNISGNAATVTTNANLTGPVTSTGNATAITNNAIANAKLAQMAAHTYKGNNTGALADPIDVTLAQLATELGVSGTNTGDQDLSGLLVKASNLSDLTDASTARTNLGLGTLATQSGIFSGFSSGTNTGDQIISLTGDVTGSGTGSFAATIANNAVTTAKIIDSAVTLAKQANMATASVVYRKTAGAGAPEVNTLATLKTDLGLTGTNSGDQTISLTGDVTGSGTGSFAATIAAAAVSLAKMANLAANSIIGNNTGSPATPIALTAAQVTAMLDVMVGDSGSGGTKGLVPAPVSGDSTKFLRGDGTFQTISGGGDALTSGNLSQFAATTSAQLAGVMSDETGSGALVFATSPTLVTPALGTPSALVGTNITGTAAGLTAGTASAANALNSATTTVNVSSATAPTTGQALIATGASAATWQNLPGGGDALTSNPLSQFAATTSAQLAGVLSDETGSGAAVFATSPTLVTPALGTPSAVVLTNGTGLPVSTGVSGLGTGVATFLATPSSANLAAAVTGETGTGALVFATSPTLVTPALGTPASGTLTNATGLPVSTGISGLAAGVATFLATPSSANLRAAVTDEAGTGALSFASNVVGIPIVIDGGGATITTGIKGDIEIPFAMTITGWTMLADQTGSIVIDIWKDTYANYPPVVGDTITASDKPTLSSANKAQDLTPTGWTTSVAAGDTLRFNVDSVTTVTRVTLVLRGTKT